MSPSEFIAWFPKGQFGASGTTPTYVQPAGTLGTDSAYVQTFLTRAEGSLDSDRWGAKYAEGVAYLTAHLITLDQSDGAQTVGQVEANDTTAERIGPISVMRHADAVMAQVRDPFLRTTYGQHYAYLRSRVGLGGVVVS